MDEKLIMIIIDEIDKNGKKPMNKLKALRDKYGLTQKQVAEKLKYSESQIARLENSDKSYGNKINRRILMQLEDWAKELEK